MASSCHAGKNEFWRSKCMASYATLPGTNVYPLVFSPVEMCLQKETITIVKFVINRSFIGCVLALNSGKSKPTIFCGYGFIWILLDVFGGCVWRREWDSN